MNLGFGLSQLLLQFELPFTKSQGLQKVTAGLN